MKQLFEILRSLRDEEDGVVTAWSLLWVLILLGIGGLAVDYANGVRAKSHLQASADAAALAAAQGLPDQALGTEYGLAIARLNAPVADFGEAFKSEDFVYGNWNPSSRVFTASGTPVNAVSVTGVRNADRDNSVFTFLLKLASVDHFDISVQSIAIGNAGDCLSGGFFAAGTVYSGSNNTYQDRFCLHGDLGVTIQSDNSFEEGTTISMNNLADFAQSQNNTIPDGTLKEDTASLTLLAGINGIRDKMLAGDISGLPGYITSVQYVSEITSSTPIQSGTLYIVDQVADFGSDVNISNIAVVAGKEIKTGSNVTMENTVFVTNDKILFGSTNDFGNADYCSSGAYSVYAYSNSNIEFGSSTLIQGMQIASKGDVKLGSNIRGLNGIYTEALTDISFGSNQVLGGCPHGLTGELIGNNSLFGLVQ